MSRIERSPFQALSIEMRAAEGPINKAKVFGVAFFSALATVITAPAALFGKDVFQILVSTAYPSSNTEFKKLKAAEAPLLGEFDQTLLQEHGVAVSRGDIFESGASAIVNPANPHLGTSGNGGLNAAIINRGGDLYKSNHDRLRKQEDGHFQPGDAAILPAGKLIVEKGIENVIVVSPPDRRGKSGPVTEEEKQQLFASYYNALELAEQHGHETIAIPSLGTGINRFPPYVGAQVCRQAIAAFYTKHPESNLQITVYAQGQDEFKAFNGIAARTLEYGEGSILRRVRETVGYLPQKAIRSLQSYFQEVRVNPEQLARLERKIADGEDSEDPTEALTNVHAGIVELRGNLPLRPSPIDAFAKSLQKRHSFHYDSRLSNVLPKESEALPELRTGDPDRLHIYPIGLATRPIRHWVMVVADPINRTIEFYDPKGLSIEDRASVPIDKYPNHTLKELMDHISQHYTREFPGEWTVVENSVPHQIDTYNCGVYISNYMRRRLGGESFNSIQSQGLGFDEASTTERELMVQEILDRTCPADEP